MTVTFSFAFLASPCYFSNILSCWKTFPFFGSLIFPPAYPSNVPKCVIFFLYDTRRNPLSAPHTPPSWCTHSHSPIVVGDVVHGRIWMHFFAFLEICWVPPLCRFFVCGARPWYLAKDCMYRNCMYAFAFRRGLASTLCHKTFGAVFLEFHVFCGLRV